MTAILNSAILDSTILAFPFKLTYTCQDWFPPFAQKKTFTHSFWLNLMLMAILNSTILDSAILVYPLKLTHTCQDWVQPIAQKRHHSHFLPHHLHKKTSFWLNLMKVPSWILPSWILLSWIQLLHCGIQTHCYLLSDSLKNTLTPLWLWLKLI